MEAAREPIEVPKDPLKAPPMESLSLPPGSPKRRPEKDPMFLSKIQQGLDVLLDG